MYAISPSQQQGEVQAWELQPVSHVDTVASRNWRFKPPPQLLFTQTKLTGRFSMLRFSVLLFGSIPNLPGTSLTKVRLGGGSRKCIHNRGDILMAPTKRGAKCTHMRVVSTCTCVYCVYMYCTPVILGMDVYMYTCVLMCVFSHLMKMTRG